MAAVATALQIQRVRLTFIDVPDAQKLEAFFEALSGLTEATGGPPVDPNLPAAQVLNDLALNFVPGPLADGALFGPAPAPLRAVIRDVLLIFVPRNLAAPAAAVAGAPGAINVETAETRKLDIQLQWLGAVGHLDIHGIQVPRIRVPRNPSAPHTCLYPQRWLLLLGQAGNNPVSVFEKWNIQMTLLLDPSSVSPVYQPRHKHLLSTMEAWLSLVPPNTTAENISYVLLRLFFTTIEQFLEVIVLTQRNTANATVATGKLNSLLALTWHKNDTLDYFTALESAKTAKTDATQPALFSGGRGRGAGQS